jgi:hypothetical protein
MSTADTAIRNLVCAALFALASGAALAADAPGLGDKVTEADLAKWDLSIGPDGAGLPPGSGIAAQGAAIYAQKCELCHGKDGGGGIANRLVGGIGTLAGPGEPVRTVGSYWPFATTVFRRRDLRADGLHPQAQRDHRRQRRDECRQPAQGEDAEPRRLRQRLSEQALTSVNYRSGVRSGAPRIHPDIA